MTIKYKYYDEAETKIKSKTWRKDGILHRLDGPAKIDYYESGNVMNETWRVDGNIHRIDGPADIGYYESGGVDYEEWWVDGNLHRPDGPAEIWYYRPGKILYKRWRLYGEIHRIDGPADIGYYESGDVYCESWYVGGIYIPCEIVINELIELIWSWRLDRMKTTRGLIEWFYGLSGLGGRRDRRGLRDFVTGL